MNNVSIVGNVGADPETRFTEGGKTVTNLRLAISNGRDTDPDWVDVTLWDKAAQTATDYVRKGHKVGIEGRLKQDRWTDKSTGEQRSKTLVVANRLHLLTTKAEAEAMAGGGGGPAQAQAAAFSRSGPPNRPAPARRPDPVDDDIPF